MIPIISASSCTGRATRCQCERSGGGGGVLSGEGMGCMARIKGGQGDGEAVMHQVYSAHRSPAKNHSVPQPLLLAPSF